MSDIENIACGGVGANGATRDELDECNASGRPYGDNTDYHQCQSAWLYLNEALQQINN